MMKLLEKIQYGFLRQRANLYLAFGNRDKAIALYERVIEGNPCDLTLSLFIATYYMGKTQYEHAKRVLEQALAVAPESSGINRLYIDVLYRTDAPVEQLIPYIQTYFAQRLPPESYQLPTIIGFFAKVFNPSVDWEARNRSVEHAFSQWDRWAYHLLTQYEESLRGQLSTEEKAV